jgi:hypothetical protein
MRFVKSRLIALGTAALGVSALIAGLVVPVATASATATAPRLIFIQWKPGTTMPAVANGWKVMAEPSPSALAKLKPGQAVPMVAPRLAKPNSAGIVNLVETPDGCVGSQLYKKLGKHATFVGATYATVNRITMHFSYGEGSSSSLEVGLSDSGAEGSFSGDGTISESTTFKQGMPTTTKASRNWWLTYFSYAEYIEVCSDGDLYFVQAYQWDSGDGVRHPKHFPRTPKADCVTELSGSSISDDRTRAATFAVGFTLNAPIGFSGSAQTGWTRDAQIDYKWHVNGTSCGTNNVPPQAAAIVAK